MVLFKYSVLNKVLFENYIGRKHFPRDMNLYQTSFALVTLGIVYRAFSISISLSA